MILDRSRYVLSGLLLSGFSWSANWKLPACSIVLMKFYFFEMVSDGACGFVASGFQFAPEEKTFSSRIFFSCFSLCAFWTRSMYFAMPVYDGLTSFWARRADDLLVYGLKVRLVSAASFSAFL